MKAEWKLDITGWNSDLVRVGWTFDDSQMKAKSGGNGMTNWVKVWIGASLVTARSGSSWMEVSWKLGEILVPWKLIERPVRSDERILSIFINSKYEFDFQLEYESSS